MYFNRKRIKENEENEKNAKNYYCQASRYGLLSKKMYWVSLFTPMHEAKTGSHKKPT